jgi:hypothetical protein
MKARLVVYGERHSARATTIKKPAGIAHCGFRVSKLIPNLGNCDSLTIPKSVSL